MRLYVGNLAREITEAELKEVFEAYGKVLRVTIMKDRSKTVSKGFGFVEMPEQGEAEKAIAGLHLSKMKGRSLDIMEERPRTQGRGGKGGRGGRRGR